MAGQVLPPPDEFYSSDTLTEIRKIRRRKICRQLYPF
jgi:hypothetical protein